MPVGFHPLTRWRQLRILEVLRAHPDGLAAENLLAAVCRPGDRVERQRWLRAIFGLADGGRISVTGKPHRTAIASALIRALPDSAVALGGRGVEAA